MEAIRSSTKRPVLGFVGSFDEGEAGSESDGYKSRGVDVREERLQILIVEAGEAMM